MHVAKITKKYTKKKCAFVLCSNFFEGSQFEKYCKDPRCIALRKEVKKEETYQPIVAENRILEKKIVSRILSKKKKIISCHCHARDSTGKVCGKKFDVILDIRRSVYPKFCSEHNNQYRRERFKLLGSKECRS